MQVEYLHGFARETGPRINDPLDGDAPLPERVVGLLCLPDRYADVIFTVHDEGRGGDISDVVDGRA